jgi:hypothetical protein
LLAAGSLLNHHTTNQTTSSSHTTTTTTTTTILPLEAAVYCSTAALVRSASAASFRRARAATASTSIRGPPTRSDGQHDYSSHLDSPRPYPPIPAYTHPYPREKVRGARCAPFTAVIVLLISLIFHLQASHRASHRDLDPNNITARRCFWRWCLFYAVKRAKGEEARLKKEKEEKSKKKKKKEATLLLGAKKARREISAIILTLVAASSWENSWEIPTGRERERERVTASNTAHSHRSLDRETECHQ